MQWDPTRRVYLTDDGEEITAVVIRTWIEDYISENQAAVTAKVSDELLTSAISVEEFFDWMESQVVSMHGAVAIIAFGGEEKMSADRWANVGSKIHGELEYLKNFKQQLVTSQRTSQALAHDVAKEVIKSPEVPHESLESLQENLLDTIMQNSRADVEDAIIDTLRETLDDVVDEDALSGIVESVSEDILANAGDRLEELIWGSVDSRSRQYLDSVYGTYENSVKAREGEAGVLLARRVCEDDASSCSDCPELATEEFLPLDEVADIGDSSCQNQCRCYVEFSYAGIEELSDSEAITVDDIGD